MSSYLTCFLGCGTGVVCPISQQSTAYCNRCDFDTSQRTCGFIKSSEISPTTPSSNLSSTCTSDPERIYSGLSLNYTGKGDNLLTSFLINRTFYNEGGMGHLGSCL